MKESNRQMEAPDRSAPKASPTGETVLHRKTRAGQAAQHARGMSLAKALRLTCAKVANKLMELPVAVLGVRSEVCAGDALDPFLPDHALLMVLDGPLSPRGGAVLDARLVTALIQQQTMGKVLKPAEGEDPRALTQTDAAICAPYLDAVLRQVAAMPDDPAERALMEGFSFGAWIEAPRVLSLALEAAEYRVFQITLDLAGGVTQGQMTLLLPCAPVPGLEPEDLAQAPEGEAQAAPAPGLEKTVQNLKADLRIGLATFRKPLGVLNALQVGAVIDLGCPDFAEVMVQTAAGKTISRGALGQIEGKRAVQVKHAYKGQQDLRRRASDREALDLPDIDSPSPQPVPAATADVMPATAAMPAPEADLPAEAPPTLPELPELPDMSDLPDFGDLPDLSDLPTTGTG